MATVQARELGTHVVRPSSDQKCRLCRFLSINLVGLAVPGLAEVSCDIYLVLRAERILELGIMYGLPPPCIKQRHILRIRLLSIFDLCCEIQESISCAANRFGWAMGTVVYRLCGRLDSYIRCAACWSGILFLLAGVSHVFRRRGWRFDRNGSWLGLRLSSPLTLQIGILTFQGDTPGARRTSAAINDGSIRAYLPMVEHFLIGPDGRFVRK